MEAEDPNFLGVKNVICVPKPCLSQFPFWMSTVSDTGTPSEFAAPLWTCRPVALLGRTVAFAGDPMPSWWSTG